MFGQHVEGLARSWVFYLQLWQSFEPLLNEQESLSDESNKGHSDVYIVAGEDSVSF
jgi:hypothetical protein